MYIYVKHNFRYCVLTVFYMSKKTQFCAINIHIINVKKASVYGGLNMYITEMLQYIYIYIT